MNSRFLLKNLIHNLPYLKEAHYARHTGIVHVHSEIGGTFRIANPWKDPGPLVLEFETEAGQDIIIQRGVAHHELLITNRVKGI